MFEQLQQIDQNLFFFINKGLSNPFFDEVLSLLRNRYFWTPLYLFLIIFFVRNYNKKGWVIIVAMLLTFGLADFISSSLVKPAVQRVRPCNDIALKADVESRIVCGSGYSFPSSHATNHFALAMFLIILFRKRWKYITVTALSWAFAISFSQIYVGVHYPFDVLAGAILGLMIGYVTGTALLYTSLFRTWKPG